MGFRTDVYAKLWKIENKGNYSIVEMSTSKKNKDTDKYETDFSNKFTRFIGTAHTQLATMKDGDTIKLGNCEVTNNYDKEKKILYTNYLVFSFSIPEAKGGTTTAPKATTKPTIVPDDNDDDSLPFN